MMAWGEEGFLPSLGAIFPTHNGKVEELFTDTHTGVILGQQNSAMGTGTHPPTVSNLHRSQGSI